jgi:hypothetical protein
MTHRQTRRAPRRVGAAIGALLVLLTAACTSDPEPPDTPTPAEETSAPLAVSTPVTRVAGRLSDEDRLALRRQVEDLLKRYAEKGLLDPAATAAAAFPGFTRGAAELARPQRTVLWRLAGREAEVEPRRLEGAVQAYAPGGVAQGATLRLDVALDVTRGERTRRVRLTGRMLLTPVGDTWRVFGFDVRRSGR